MPLVGSGCPGQRTTTSGLCRARKTSSSLEFQASSSVCINSALRSSVLIAPPSLWRPPLEGKHVLGYLSSDEGNGDGTTLGRAGLPVGENRGDDTPRRKCVSVGASGEESGHEPRTAGPTCHRRLDLRRAWNAKALRLVRRARP